MQTGTNDEITLIIGIAGLLLLTFTLWLICMGFNKSNKKMEQEKKELGIRHASMETDKQELSLLVKKMENGEYTEELLDKWGIAQ